MKLKKLSAIRQIVTEELAPIREDIAALPGRGSLPTVRLVLEAAGFPPRDESLSAAMDALRELCVAKDMLDIDVYRLRGECDQARAEARGLSAARDEAIRERDRATDRAARAEVKARADRARAIRERDAAWRARDEARAELAQARIGVHEQALREVLGPEHVAAAVSDRELIRRLLHAARDAGIMPVPGGFGVRDAMVRILTEGEP